MRLAQQGNMDGKPGWKTLLLLSILGIIYTYYVLYILDLFIHMLHRFDSVI